MRFVSATVLNIKSPTLKSGDAYCLLPNVCNAQPPWWVMALTDHKTCTFYGCLPNNANVERSLLITSVLVLQHASSRVQVRSTLEFPLVSLLEELERWIPFLAPAMTMINCETQSHTVQRLSSCIFTCLFVCSSVRPHGDISIYLHCMMF